MGETTRRVPGNMRVQDLRTLVERLFDILASKQRTFIQLPSSVVPVPLDDDNRTLLEYGVSSDAIIIIEEGAG